MITLTEYEAKAVTRLLDHYAVTDEADGLLPRELRWAIEKTNCGAVDPAVLTHTTKWINTLRQVHCRLKGEA